MENKLLIITIMVLWITGVTIYINESFSADNDNIREYKLFKYAIDKCEKGYIFYGNGVISDDGEIRGFKVECK